MLFMCQKFKSNYTEEFGADEASQAVFDDLNPWLSGRKDITPIVAKLVDSENIQPVDFYNMMIIADKFMPYVFTMSSVLEIDSLPAPDISWVRGWDPE